MDKRLDLDKLKYPIGKFTAPEELSREELNRCISDICLLPEKIITSMDNLDEDLLDVAYRPDGWTRRQVVHHLADSHMNAYVRFKLALTEDNPTIKPYGQDAWAELQDSVNYPIEASLKIIDGVHSRWGHLLDSMLEADFKRTFFHPESKKLYTLEYTTALYAWHGNHHLAQISQR